MKRSWKRLAVLMMVLTLIGTVLTGCGGGGSMAVSSPCRFRQT